MVGMLGLHSGAIALRRIALTGGIGLCGLGVMSLSAWSDDALPVPPHPIWTLVPTHIDRDKETYVRIDPVEVTANHFDVSADRPIRLGANGVFFVDGKPMQIFGLVMSERQKLCVTRGGQRWACGIRAQAIFIHILATRILSCERLSPLGASVTVASCKAGDSDIAERMVSDGWAAVDGHAGVELQALGLSAQKGHRGIWSETIPDF